MTNTATLPRSPEVSIARRVFRALKAAGDPIVTIFDGEEDIPVTTEREALEAVFAVDQAHMLTASRSWVFIVNGNDWDALADYTTDLEAVVGPVCEWASDQDTA